jgi:hypothetical protein
MTDFALSEHLVAFTLDLCAALVVAWVFAKYYPRWADYRARRSEIAAKKRGDRLAKILNEYEEATTNVIVFVGRIIRRGVFAVVWLIAGISLMMLNLIEVVSAKILCHFDNTCSEFHLIQGIITVRGLGLSQLVFTIITLPVVTFIFVIFYTELDKFGFECSPERHRSVMQKRIERLRSRA